MKAAAYTRFSTDKQSEGEAGTIAQQLGIIREFAKRLGCKVEATYTDEGISGAAVGNRPGLQAALAAAEAGAFQVLIVADLSRLSRSQADLPRIIERLSFRGVRVIGAQDGFDSSREDSELAAGLHGIIGQQFRRMIANRTRSALKLKAEQNAHAGGKPYGYRTVNGEHGRALLVDSEEAEIVREVFGRYAAGEGARDIARDLNARAIPSPGATWKRTARRADGRWLNSGVRSILTNPIYRGEWTWNKSLWRKDPDTGRRIRIERPQHEWIIRQAPELRIVSEELWTAVQERFHARVRTFANAPGVSRRGGQPRYLLSGLLECGVCGCKLIVSGARYGRYVCSSHRNGGEHACANALSVSKRGADAAILEELKAKLLAPDAIKVYAAEYSRACRELAQAPRAEATSPPAKVARIEREIAELERLVREGILSPAVAGAALERARGERARLLEAEEQSQARGVERVVRVFPRAADELRRQVDALGESLEDPEILASTRPLVHRFCGGRVPVRPDESGKVLIAEVTWSAAPLLMAAGAGVWNGSGGRI